MERKKVKSTSGWTPDEFAEMKRAERMVKNEVEKTLESPFKWGISKTLAEGYDEGQELELDSDDQPIIALIEALTLAFINTQKEKVYDAERMMNKATRLFNELEANHLKGIAPEVIEHVYMTSKYECQKYRDLKLHSRSPTRSEYVEFISTVPDLLFPVSDNDVVRGSINGCKSISWSMFHEEELGKAIKFAEAAVEASPRCPLWHFILGKNLRRRRRHDDFNLEPTQEESMHLLTAYKLSNADPYFGVFAAQMFRESKNNEKARDLYLSIYQLKPKSVAIRLRLALAFIRSKEFDMANECLKYAGKLNPDNSMYLHYMGIFYEKQKNYTRASEFFDKAAKLGNSTAEFQYADAMVKSRRNFDRIDHYKKMIIKYEAKTSLVQQLMLHIAMNYYFKKKDIRNSMIYFSKALTIDPKSSQLKSFFNCTIDYKDYNIFDFVKKYVLKDLIAQTTDKKDELALAFKNVKI